MKFFSVGSFFLIICLAITLNSLASDSGSDSDSDSSNSDESLGFRTPPSSPSESKSDSTYFSPGTLVRQLKQLNSLNQEKCEEGTGQIAEELNIPIEVKKRKQILDWKQFLLPLLKETAHEFEDYVVADAKTFESAIPEGKRATVLMRLKKFQEDKQRSELEGLSAHLAKTLEMRNSPILQRNLLKMDIEEKQSVQAAVIKEIQSVAKNVNKGKAGVCTSLAAAGYNAIKEKIAVSGLPKGSVKVQLLGTWNRGVGHVFVRVIYQKCSFLLDPWANAMQQGTGVFDDSTSETHCIKKNYPNEDFMKKAGIVVQEDLPLE